MRKANDNRCLEVTGPAGLVGINLDPWKFGGLTKETIDKFFDDLWLERKARNVYNSVNIGPKMAMLKKSQQSDFSPQRNVNFAAPKLVESLNARIEELENDLLAFKTRDKKGKDIPLFTAKQVAIILKALLLEHNSLTNNAKLLAPLVQRFGGGWAPTTAENALGYEVTQKECDDLDDIFKPFAPKIGRIIKAYPKKFREVKEEKLQDNLKK